MLFLLFVANGCDAIWPRALNANGSSSLLPKIRPSLKVAAIRQPLSGHELDHPGFEAELLNLFAENRGYKISWQLMDTAQDVAAALARGQVDLGAARFNVNLAYEGPFLTGPSYEESALSLICPRVRKSWEDEDDSLLAKFFSHSTVEIPASVKSVLFTSQDLSSDDLKKYADDDPKFEWIKADRLTLKDRLRLISRKQNACVLMPRTEAVYFLRMYPGLQWVRDLKASVSLGFLVNPKRPDLRDELFAWFQFASRNHSIENIRDLYFSQLESLSQRDQRQFFRNIQNELPELAPSFKKVAHEFSIPWKLLAAVAYQESHWDNSARSFTGVEGIMMLTSGTAEHMGITDRTDLNQSLWGGAKYLRALLDAQPDHFTARQRLVFALASYNVGPAHILDAQKLAQDFGRNPESWRDIKKVLPLLSKPEYYENLDYGEARGQEPVDFVGRVLGFYEILSQ